MKWTEESRYALESVDTPDESVWIGQQLAVVPSDVHWGCPLRAVTNDPIEISFGRSDPSRIKAWVLPWLRWLLPLERDAQITFPRQWARLFPQPYPIRFRDSITAFVDRLRHDQTMHMCARIDSVPFQCNLKN